MTSGNLLAETVAALDRRATEVATAWMGTSAAQIFFMQLGFLCYEVGYVKPVWIPSIILKNIEDTFIGVLVFMSFTYTLGISSPSIGGIISVPNQPFLIGVDVSEHDHIFLDAVFAATCSTIISGAVLERMKNKAYIVYCAGVMLLNYAFISHWIWHPDGWLNKLGFVDGAGAVVIHSTGGIAGAIALFRLGPRRGSLNKDGSLKEVQPAQKPTMIAVGAFILWYGWFAFNVSSPVANQLGIGSAVGTTALVTLVAPTCSCCSALILMYWDRWTFAEPSYDNLLGALLSGLVAITGTCYTCNVWEAAVIGSLASFVYFLSVYTLRYKFGLDDPLQIVSVHASSGLFSCFMEGVVANDVTHHAGLLRGGYQHFGVQLLGIVVVTAFNIACCSFIYLALMERIIFRKTEIGVSILDTFLGVSLFSLSNTMALEEVLEGRSNLAKQMSFDFHWYTVERFADEQFDFLIAIYIFRDLLQWERDPQKIAKAAVQLIEAYVMPEAPRCVNLTSTQRSQLIRVRNQLKYELKELANGFIPSQIPSHRNEKYSNRKGFGGTNELMEHVEVPQPILADDGSVLSGAESPHGRKRSYLMKQRPHLLLNRSMITESLFDAAHAEVFKIILPVFSQFLSRFDKKLDTIKETVRLPFVLRQSWALEWDEKLTRQLSGERAGSLWQAAAPDPTAQYEDFSVLTADDGMVNNMMTMAEELELVNPMQGPLNKPFTPYHTSVNVVIHDHNEPFIEEQL